MVQDKAIVTMADQ